MRDTIFIQLQKRLNETYDIAPSDLRNKRLTYVFKGMTAHLKSFPFKLLIPFSVVSTILLYGLVGYLVVRLTSILQFGF